MNYWAAEPAGMQRYVEALLQHVERLVPHARKAAGDLYGCHGVWYPIRTDAWGRSTPESYAIRRRRWEPRSENWTSCSRSRTW